MKTHMYRALAAKKILFFAAMCLMALSMNAQSAQQTTEQTAPYVIYGYLHVFPNDLGTFDSEPKTIIARLNQNRQYGYGTWRLPTNEELALMRANKVIGDGNYMTRENRQGIVRLVTDREQGETLPAIPLGYVDLGLPSGALWKEENELAGFFTYDEAVAKFGDHLPTKEQWEELKTSCRWTWTGSGYSVEGPNGESITLPAKGRRFGATGSVHFAGSDGGYWSSTPSGSGKACFLLIDSSIVLMSEYSRSSGLSVRLVYNE
jgi:hypothetical protein